MREPAVLGGLLPSPSAPMEVAHELLLARHTDASGAMTLRHWRGGWWQWQGPRWFERTQRGVASDAYHFTEHARYWAGDTIKPWAPNRNKIANLLDALAAIVYLPEEVSMPSWLDGTAYDGLLVSTQNGLLDVGARTMLEHTPTFFNATSVPLAYDPSARQAERWLAFLDALWPGESASAAALQEWFGYVISGRLDLHKILLLIGPTRAGKGVMARILGEPVGRRHCRV
jgi:putative DNA primase/helicase